jgi:ATP-dependent DNA helicase RecG
MTQPHIDLDSPLEALPGVGPKRRQAFAARGLITLRDLLLYLPARYDDWRKTSLVRDLAAGTEATVAGKLGGLREHAVRGGRFRRLIRGYLQDAAGDRIAVVWFNAPAYMRELLAAPETVVIHGKVGTGSDGRTQFLHPDVLPLAQAPAILPEYRVGDELGQRVIRGFIAHALPAADRLAGAMPDEVRTRMQLLSLGQALRYLHQPPPDADVEALANGLTPAHRALAIDELFALESALLAERARARPGIAFAGERNLTQRFLDALPFQLTAAQQAAIARIDCDMVQPRPMNRLLLGDVGSGKTVIALWAVLRAIEHGYQAAVMTPTELLAEQHYQTFIRLCAPLNVPAFVMTGRLGAPQRRAILSRAASREALVLFGTHALIQRSVRMARLGIAVIDEQHRFGVFDRLRLKALGPQADLLLLSATPIPRSLARVLLANLDVTHLDERPPGRAPIFTRVVGEGELEPVWEAVRAQARARRQTYCILPLIESDERQELAVESVANSLAQGPLKGLAVGVMHGRLPAAARDAMMRRFRDGESQVLVATTVIEVGIDVPAANIIVIFGAERYGLAQLHQLRGRIGRANEAGYCYLVMGSGASAAARARLEVLAQKNAGAEIAEADLQMRGPGNLFGTRQSGPLPLRYGSWLGDLRTVELVRDFANEWLRRDPALTTQASAALRAAIERIAAAGASWDEFADAG